MKANPVFSLYIPTKLVFGCGEIKKLSSEKLPGKKALVVISSGTSMRKYGYLERVLAQLRLNNVETLVYDKILPNPIKEHVMEAAAICREEKCDFVVGLGGGSSTTWHSRTPLPLRPAEKPSGTLSEKRLYVYRKPPKRFCKNALTFSLKRKYVLLQTQVRFDGNTRTFVQDKYNPLQKAS